MQLLTLCWLHKHVLLVAVPEWSMCAHCDVLLFDWAKKKKWVESFQQILLLFYRNDDEGDDGDRGASERAKQLFLISWMV